MESGIRESTQSWREVLLDLKFRGLTKAPKLAICDGALGFQNAVDEIWGQIKIQRCWFHKTANILDKIPKCVQKKATQMIRDMHMAERTVSCFTQIIFYGIEPLVTVFFCKG